MDPAYREREKVSHKKYMLSAEAKQKRVANQVRYERKLNYGLSQADFDAMLEAQNFKCAICETEDSGKRSWHVDHDHETGEVRGLLCLHCNVGLGHFKDRTDLLGKAADYLNYHRNK